MKFYVSTYTEGFFGEGLNGSKGLYLVEYKNNELKILNSCDESINPSFIKLSKDKKNLFVACEKLPPGRLDNYLVDKNGNLKLNDSFVLDGRSCCYVSVNKENEFVTATHYGSGDVFTVSIDKEGKFLKKTSSFKNDNPGPNKDRQKCGHAHSVRLIEALNTYVVCDLGCDMIDFYDYSVKGNFTKSKIKSIKVPSGFGPRHTINSKDGRYLYVTCELANKVLFYEFIDGQYILKQNISTIAESYFGNNTCADIHISDDDKYLYVSNRGDDSIAEYSINEFGDLKLIDIVKCDGNGPRNFVLSKNFIICANQDSNDITILQIKDKLLTGKVLNKLEFTSPVCIEIYEGEE